MSYLQQKQTTFSLQKTEMCFKENDITLLFSSIKNKSQVDVVARRGARLLDEVERSGARRLQTARAWPRAAQQQIGKLTS